MVSLPFADVLEGPAKINHCSPVSSKAWLVIAAIAYGVLPFLTAPFENAALTGSSLAKARHLWPVLLRI
jgi:hypothetical protein